MSFRPTEALVDLTAIEHNIACYKNQLPESCEIMAVVKANGYGHGAAPVLSAAVKAGATWAGVALMEEAVQLRMAGFGLPILMLGGFYPDALEKMVGFQVTPTVYSFEVADKIQAYAKSLDQVITVHLKVDTGMGRLGFSWADFELFMSKFEDYSHLKIDGLMTHFASADHEDKTFTDQQIELFYDFKRLLKTKADPKYFHLCNSAGASDLEHVEGNMVRIGIGMYGQQPSKELVKPLELKEAISVTSSVIQVKTFEPGATLGYGQSYKVESPSTIATVAIGYGDGYPRLLSNVGRVLIAGQLAPIVGRVSMDMILVDVTALGEVRAGDLVTLIGKDGDQEITATEIADLCNTINYEITCGFTARVPRNYIS